MATVTVEINGRPYAVGCADGQEDRVRVLARQFDNHVRQVAADVGHVGDLRLFLMAALVLADELHEARLAVGGEITLTASAGAAPSAEAGVAEALNAVAARIEKITRSL
ncbi:cell division protein ZapA [Brevundimonas sp. LM2]|uniref:cell division protein ZapA n=1 Tax=Brevundimonas sp. LM2 TaxID=1938605 RepID=UPI000983BA7C|nr:cell division protein ZapA [Brevundimonas sp. LM2]AQR62616.1 cell division protein ZapA [Brevundimonas sp. LM2]